MYSTRTSYASMLKRICTHYTFHLFTATKKNRIVLIQKRGNFSFFAVMRIFWCTYVYCFRQPTINIIDYWSQNDKIRRLIESLLLSLLCWPKVIYLIKRRTLYFEKRTAGKACFNMEWQPSYNVMKNIKRVYKTLRF